MTTEEIKKMLLDIHPTDTDFTVVLTGKASIRVNGLYKPDTKEILVHNKNFTSDNQLIYTAIHEYCHHLLNNGIINSRCHTKEFWFLYHNLLDIAVQKGFYTRDRSDLLNQMISEAKKIDVEIAGLERKLGLKLAKIQLQCEKEKVRVEDVIDRDLQMKRTTAHSAVRCSLVPEPEVTEVGQDVQKVLAGSGSVTERERIKNDIQKGKTLIQISSPPSFSNDEIKNERLQREKSRLEKTISVLQKRLLYVINIIEESNQKMEDDITTPLTALQCIPAEVLK